MYYWKTEYFSYILMLANHMMVQLTKLNSIEKVYLWTWKWQSIISDNKVTVVFEGAGHISAITKDHVMIGLCLMVSIVECFVKCLWEIMAHEKFNFCPKSVVQIKMNMNYFYFYLLLFYSTFKLLTFNSAKIMWGTLHMKECKFMVLE